MIRQRTAEDICAFCDEYRVRDAEPEYAAIGMGRCNVQAENPPLSKHVGWNALPCVSYRLDRANIAARRQYVRTQQQANQEKP